MKKLNENIAYAKSVLLKKGIKQDSEEYKDFTKIREICGENHGYVGILTKLRFVDNVTDIDELRSIFEVLKKSKFDFAKLNKLTYDEILNLFYDELAGKDEDKKDVELVFKDHEYTFYKVHTYEGILKIGSPAWCLKTKTYWDKYLLTYPQVWVAVDNRYVNKLITPDTNYLSEYKSDKGWVRFGISLRENDNNTINYAAFSDNNAEMKFEPNNYTFYGVLCTIFNLLNNNKKSYYDWFGGCEKYKDSETWHKVVNNQFAAERLQLDKTAFDDREVYLTLSKSYSYFPVALMLNNSTPVGFYITRTDSKAGAIKNTDWNFVDISGKYSKMIMDEYAIKSNDDVYLGIKLKLGKITLDDITKIKKYVGKVGKWLIFDRNDNYYLMINSELGESYEIPLRTLDKVIYGMENPMYWYLEKKTHKVFGDIDKQNSAKLTYSKEVIDYIKGIKKEITKPKEEPKNPDWDKVYTPKKEEPKKVKGFWDFLKRNKE